MSDLLNTNPVCELKCACGSTDLLDLGACRSPGVNGLSSEERELSLRLKPGRLFRCRSCHLGLRLPQLDEKSLQELYSAIPAGRWNTESVLGSAQLQVIRTANSVFRNQLNVRVLDVGAYDGRFLAALPAEFSKSAIEPSSGGRESLRDRGFPVLKDFLEPADDNQRGRFDMVTMFDVFEHLPDPISGMQALMSYVRPGGRLFVGTGNMDHWSWAAVQGQHWYLDPMQHVVVGSAQHFQWLQSQLPQSELRVYACSHLQGSWKQRLAQAAQMTYFGARLRTSATRMSVRLMHRVPYFRGLAHKQAVGYTQQLRDHLLAEFIRLEPSA